VKEINRPSAEVRLAGLSKRYGAVTAVKPLDLVVEGGTLVTLLGPSGCGKTTLLRMIAGLEQATTGTIHIGGRDVTLLSARERNVSMVFQSYALFPHMTVAENVAYGLHSTGTAADRIHGEVARLLDMVGLAGLGARAPSELSGGQQQRVALARALVLAPDVLLFDEPLSNLDTRLRRQMRGEIRAIQQRLGTTVVYVTHDQEEAMAVSDRIVVMRNAEIAAEGTPRDLYERPPNAFVANFMGEANILEGSLENAAAGKYLVRIQSTSFEAPAGELRAGPVRIVARPAALSVSKEEMAGGGPLLAGRVDRVSYLGTHIEFVVDTAAGKLLIFQNPDVYAYSGGEAVLVHLDPGSLVLLPS
jgi:iron(III) transport system ATP-binding protein